MTGINVNFFMSITGHEPDNDNINLVLCGSEKNYKRYSYNYFTVHSYDNNLGSTLKFSPQFNIDTHYKLNEGSGIVTYSSNGEGSGIWQRGYAGDPHWVQGIDSESTYDPMHVAFYRDTGEGIIGIDLEDNYQRAIRLGKIGEQIDSVFKFSDSAPTGDFTIFINLTHSGHTPGNILQYIDSGRPNANNYADFRIYGGSGTYSFEIYDVSGNVYGSTVTPSDFATSNTNYENKNVRPCLVATYGGPNKSSNIYVIADSYKPTNPSYQASGNYAYLLSDRRVSNSGDMYMPGIPGSFGLENGPNYYEEFGILDRYVTYEEAQKLAHSVRPVQVLMYRDDVVDEDTFFNFPWLNILHERKNPIWPGFDTSGKGYIEFDVPTYSGYTKDYFSFLAPHWGHHDSGTLLNLSSSANSLKINTFISHATSNPSGLELLFSIPQLDWSGHPIVLNSGEYYIEVTGSFPNGTRTFDQITGTGLANIGNNSGRSGPVFRCDLKNIGVDNNFYTANTKIYGIDVSYSGDYKPHSFDPAPTGLTLFTEGVIVESSGIDLFIESHLTDSGYFDLFTEGSITLTGVMPLHTKAGQINTLNPSQQLFVYGHTDNNSSGTLFVQGHIVDSGYHTLFINGIFTDTNTMNLYIKGTPPADSSGNLPMYVLASSGVTSGFKTTPMFISSFSGPYPSGGMNLFLSSPETVTYSLTNTMNLFMKGLGDESGYQQNSNTINMFIQNDAVGDSGNFPLFINNQTSNSSGYVPVSGFMNLFINRQFESVSHNFPMFINGPSGDNSNVTLFMQAQPNDRSGISMYIDGIGASNNPIDLYTHGY